MELGELKSKYEESQKNLHMIKRLAAAGTRVYTELHMEL